MEDLLDRVVHDVSSLVHPRHSALHPAAARALEPGKLFRPRLTLQVAALLGLPDAGAAVDAAAAIELLHMSSLVHDDLMDDSPQRRGVPAIHAAVDPATAIAVGNLLLARGAALAAGLGAECARAFAGAVESLWEGQLMETALNQRYSLDDHLQYIALKTAALMAATTELGALSQGADAEMAGSFRAFGHEIGMAFQLADDLLDHIGDPAALGKEVGGDTARGIVSVGGWYALRLRGLAHRDVSAARLNAISSEDDAVAHALGAINERLEGARATLEAFSGADIVWRAAYEQVSRMLTTGSPQRRELILQRMDALR